MHLALITSDIIEQYIYMTYILDEQRTGSCTIGRLLSTHGWINPEMFLTGFIHLIFYSFIHPITVIS